MTNDKLETIDTQDLTKCIGGAGDQPGANLAEGIGRPPRRPQQGGCTDPNCTACGRG